MDCSLDICTINYLMIFKNNSMSKVIDSNYQSAGLSQNVANDLKRAAFWKAQVQRIKRYIPSVSVLAFLGLWMNMTYENNLHFKESLLCSLIIGIIVLVRTAEQDAMAKSKQ